ncbi:precorrin-6Y C5,15-methyltransferase (decarboxylating) subunit CbiT [Candidatus Pyrohabitans sp.]
MKRAVPGIPDDAFERGGVPMTKQEVRAVALAKLGLCRGEVLYDVGAGTGSVSVEAALLGARVYAVERQEKAIALLRRNLARFGIAESSSTPGEGEVRIVEGEAPGALHSLKPPHRVFIGGSGGRVEEIVEAVTKKLHPEGRVVITAITLETLHRARAALEAAKFEQEVVLMSVARAEKVREGVSMMRSMNPVFIITGWR